MLEVGVGQAKGGWLDRAYRGRCRTSPHNQDDSCTGTERNKKPTITYQVPGNRQQAKERSVVARTVSSSTTKKQKIVHTNTIDDRVALARSSRWWVFVTVINCCAAFVQIIRKKNRDFWVGRRTSGFTHGSKVSHVPCKACPIF